MTHQPNFEQARNRFIERVANAYFQTWAAFGYAGDQFTFAKATEYAASIAEHCFPLPLPPMIVADVNLDDQALRDMLMRSGPAVVMWGDEKVHPAYAFQPQELEQSPIDPDAPCGDGVSGD